jgi:hypothetical protein
MVHIGIDMHKRFSEVAALDDVGKVISRQKLYHDDRTSLVEYFRNAGSDAIATLEASRSWYWLSDLIQDTGIELKLAHPKKVRLIAEATIKTDKIDAWTLAQLERTGFLPEAYIPPHEEGREGRGQPPYYEAAKARHDKMVPLVERMLELHKDLPKARTAPGKTAIERQIAAKDRDNRDVTHS